MQEERAGFSFQLKIFDILFTSIMVKYGWLWMIGLNLSVTV